MKVLSVIIPSCNMEKYLPRCLGSLSPSSRDEIECSPQKGIDWSSRLEIIIVNDGSKDRTSEIGHEFERKFPDSVRVIDKPNGHYGSCVNVGVKAATGIFVKILDADDYFERDALKKFLEYLILCDRDGIDAVFTDFVLIDETGRRSDTVVPCRLPVGHDFNLDALTQNERIQVMHSITYRLEVVRKIEYRQTEGQPYTDNEWALLPMLHMGKMRYYPLPLYRYLIGRTGQSISAEQCAKNISKHEVMLEHMMVAAEASRHDSVRFDYACKFVVHNAHVIYEVVFFSLPIRDGLKKLTHWESILRTQFPQCYSELAKLTIDRRIPVQYVEGWRKRSFTRRGWIHFIRFLKWGLDAQRKFRGL